MSVIAIAARHLIAAGLSGDALVAAIADIEEALAVRDAATAGMLAVAGARGTTCVDCTEAENPVTESVTEALRVTPETVTNVTRNVTRYGDRKEKSANAVRQARYRARKAQQAAENVTPGVTEALRVTPETVTSVTRNVTRYAAPLSDKERSPTPPKEINYPPPDLSLRSRSEDHGAREAGDLAADQSSRSEFSVDADAAVRAYSLMARANGLAVPRKIDGRRRRQLLVRLRENGLPAVLEAIAKMGASAWCRGENDRGWRADFDFLLQPKSFIGLLEGRYDDRPARQRSPPAGRQSAMHEHRERALASLRSAIDGDDYAEHREPARCGPDIDLGPGDFRACR